MGEIRRGGDLVVPPDFAEMVARLFAPGEAEAGAEVLQDVLASDDDEELGDFIERLTLRIRSSSLPLTAAELRNLAGRGAPDDEALPPPA